MLTKEKVQDLIKNTKGHIRGVGIKQDWSFVLREKGREGLEKLENKMKGLGYPLRYDEIKTGGTYPLGVDRVSLLLMKELFGFGKEDFIKMGMSYLELSLIFKIFARYLLSPKKIVQRAPKIWKEYYDVGLLKVVNFDEEKKQLILRIEDFQIDPIYCWIYEGNFKKSLQVVTKGNVTCKETKCTFRGDPYHEFLLTWD